MQVKVLHVHQWDGMHNISPQQFGVSEPYPALLQVVELQMAQPGGDTDHCTKANCPFTGGNAANATHTNGWSATAGTFGRLSGTTFIPIPDPAGQAAQVTHWQAPASISGRTLDVTLTRATDDTPSAQEPGGATTSGIAQVDS